MAVSGCLKAGELLLGTKEAVHLDSGARREASCHHDPVLKFNGTSTPYMKMITIYLQWLATQLLPGLIWQTEGVCGVGDKFCTGPGPFSSHQKYPGWTLPRHMVIPPHRQKVGLLPLSTECQAAEPSSVPATARSERWLCMMHQSSWWESGQQAAMVTREPHLGWVGDITIKTAPSRYQKSWEWKLIVNTLITYYHVIQLKIDMGAKCLFK